MLEWLRAQDAPWDASVCAAAAERGDISMLRWLRGQTPPCPWDEAVSTAAVSMNITTLQWLRGQYPPCPWGLSSLLAAQL